ncbi:MAG TPA: hypothetical protein VLA58_06560 [Chitinophagaceae bacterium]|nr:hypothetical protein [Chitinophagaceae bacterium]
MRNKRFYFLLILVAMTLTYSGFAQETEPAEMADVMRSNGKIYVVIAVILTILAGLIFYVVRLDRKISKLEKGE